MFSCTFVLTPSSQSSQHTANNTVCLPMNSGRASPCLGTRPPCSFPGGTTRCQRKTPSLTNPMRSAARHERSLPSFVCHCTRRSFRSSRHQRRSSPTACVVTCVRWNGGSVNTNPISVHRFSREVFSRPITPASSLGPSAIEALLYTAKSTSAGSRWIRFSCQDRKSAVVGKGPKATQPHISGYGAEAA